MQAILDYTMHIPLEHRTKSRREARQQAAVEDEDIDLCSSPPRRRQLPPRNEAIEKLQEKLDRLQKRMNQIECELNTTDVLQTRHSGGEFPLLSRRLSTIYECDDEDI